jgi:hypothetical protein
MHFAIAHHHFRKGEYEAALAAARKVNLPGFFWAPVYLAGLYAELGRKAEARSALEELLRADPAFTRERLIEEFHKWNSSDEMIRRWVGALCKAGLPE